MAKESDIGMLNAPSTVNRPRSPASTSTYPEYPPSISALRVCTLIAPPIELRPNRKPCGPRNTSARSMSYMLVTAEPLRPSYSSFLKMAAEGSPPTPKSWVLTPRMLTASMKLSWLLPVTPGVKDIRSLTSSRLTDCVNSPVSAVIASGTSCSDSSRLLHDSPSIHPDTHAGCGLVMTTNLANIGRRP